MAQKCYKMNYTKLKTIEKLNNYKQMYLKAQQYKNDSISEFQRFESAGRSNIIFDFVGMKEYRKQRISVYYEIQNRIEQRINNLIKELKTQ